LKCENLKLPPFYKTFTKPILTRREDTCPTDAEGNTQPLEARWNVQGMAQNMVQRLGVTVQ